MSSDLPHDFLPDKLPVHVAVIMDGNGRWAKKRLLNRVMGHERGVNAVRDIVSLSRELNIPYLTLYAFSTENWERPRVEVNALMRLLKKFLASERPKILENDIRLNAIGELDSLPDDIREDLEDLMMESLENKGMVLTLCLSYGGRAEILSAARALAIKAVQGLLDPEQLSEEVLSRHLYTFGLPDPDLLIRTSGELRLSNFMLWQLAYTEFVFTPTLWPDFSKKEYIEILRDFQQRDRRFGQLKGL